MSAPFYRKGLSLDVANPGSPSYLRTGTPSLAKFLLDLGYNTGQFGKNHPRSMVSTRSTISLASPTSRREACNTWLSIHLTSVADRI
jgi:arylsulfatase A-like enzyme